MLKLRVGIPSLKIPHVARKSLSATTKANAMQSKKKKNKNKKTKKEREETRLRDQTRGSVSPTLASGFFTTSATWEAPIYSSSRWKS